MVRYNWHGLVPDEDDLNIVRQLIEFEHEDYNLKNLQAKILAHLVLHKYPNCWENYLEPIVELLQNDNFIRIELAIKVLINLLNLLEDEPMKLFHQFVPKILPSLYSAFTNGETDAHGRDQILEVLNLCLRTVSWADGVDNELVGNCLNETFNTWMALIKQIIKTNPKAFFDVKKNALKCLTVIFRDFMTYSRDCINQILEPSWQLLNFHLPVFTEVLGYNQSLKDFQGDDQETEEYNKGYESEEEGEPEGVEGMTLQLIELLTTLISRQNVQEVVKQGIVPLITTISSYMIIQHSQERQHVGDNQHFIHEKDEDFYKQRTIRNSCLDLISSLIDVFGDLAVESILFVVENLFLTTSASQSSPTKIKSSVQAQSVEEVNIYDYTYSSSHRKHTWKKREVALFLIGRFADSISMFRIRNPNYNLRILIEEIMKTNFEKCRIKSYLKGRTLQCASQLSEIMPRDYEELHQNILEMSIDFLCEKSNLSSIKLVATQCLLKFARKLKTDTLMPLIRDRFELILDELTGLLDTTYLETIYLPIQVFVQYSRLNEEIVAQMAPKITPKLLKFFKNYHSEGALANELLNLFKIWCNYDACRDIFVNTFIPFIMEIIDNYYQSTPNIENKDSMLVPQNLVDLSADKSQSNNADGKVMNIVDSTILQHVIDLLCTLLRKTKDKDSTDFQKITDVFPKLLDYVNKSEDMFLLLHGTAALKTFIHLGSQEILKKTQPKEIIEVAKKLLSPTTNEQAALFLIFARLIHSHPKEIVEFLSETSIDNRISLKIVLDKWLLQQPLFRGYYTKNVTFSALMKLFIQRDPRIESLMVIGYNPSHSNVNSEVNAPFKILSIMLRYLDNELSPKKGKRTLPPPDSYDDADEEEQKSGGITPGYSLRRDLLGDGVRLDTMEGDDEDGNYDDDNDDKHNDGGTDKIEVNLDDVQDDDDNESLLGLRNNSSLLQGGGLFTIKESKDGGLADMETGSEVYMSELLAGFDMEDYEEAEDQNEEDLIELGDSFGNINLKNHIQDTLAEFTKTDKAGAEYLMYCVRQLTNEDQELAKKYLKLGAKATV
eukprot:403331713